jgi:hypothetical protein
MSGRLRQRNLQGQGLTINLATDRTDPPEQSHYEGVLAEYGRLDDAHLAALGLADQAEQEARSDAV